MKPDTLCSVEAQEQHPRWPCCAPSLGPSRPISCSWGFPLQPQNTTRLFSKQDQLCTEAASKVSVQCVNFPSRWQVLGNNKPRQLTYPSPHVVTTAFANPFQKTQMMFWGKDKVFQTWNWLLQLSLVSDQTQSSLKVPLKGHSQQAAKGVRPAGTGALTVYRALYQVYNFGMETQCLFLVSLPSTAYINLGVNRSKVKVNLS